MVSIRRLLGACTGARSGAVLAITASLALPAVGPASAFLAALGVPTALAWLLTAGTVCVRFLVGGWLVVREFVPLAPPGSGSISGSLSSRRRHSMPASHVPSAF